MNGIEAKEAAANETAPVLSPDDPRVVQAVEDYLAALEAGRPPERHQFLAANEDIAEVLGECLDGLQLVHQLGPRLRCPEIHQLLPHPELLEGARQTPPLGDFRLVREIGRGGMGVVYEAVQESLGRRVALKILPFTAALDPKQLQRFKNEAQAAAHLHHPSIVQVYAVGCARGVHYYAMQHIEGHSLAALIQDLRAGRQDQSGRAEPSGGAGGPGAGTSESTAAQGEQPPAATGAGLLAELAGEYGQRRAEYFRRVARLGQQAADALEYAHQLAVVHRDVKPANLLLDLQGHPWITDFGLALIPNQTAVTLSGELLGTLRYMSPEQALGKRGLVDHRTDIYSLGATLYELLTLRPVFDGQDRQELLGQIAAQEPRPPRQIDPGIPVDLETILLKAMAKSPGERYATAQEFADDLQRFLEDRPILARRPTLLEKAAKWARRHRRMVLLAVALLVVAVAALLVTTVAIVREHAATQNALEGERRKTQEARQQRARAEQNFRQARKAVDFLTQISEGELADLPYVQCVRRKLLEAALVYYQDFIDQHQDDPSIQADLEASHAQVRQILAELSLVQEVGRFWVLGDRGVQQDLKLTDSQRKQVMRLVDKMSEQWREVFRHVGQISPVERHARSLEVARSTEKALAELLNPDQAARFKQVVLQVQQRGPFGFSDPDLVKALQLTVKQRQKIHLILKQVYLPPWNGLVFEGGPWKKGRKPPPPPAPSWNRVEQRILAVLTPGQREKWHSLAGEPLPGEVRLVLPGGFEPRFLPPRNFGMPVGNFGPRRPKGF